MGAGGMVDPQLPKLRERRQFLSVDIYQGRARMQANSPTQTEYDLVGDWQAEYNELDLVIGTVDRLAEFGVTLPAAVRVCAQRSRVDWFSTWQLLLIAAATFLFVVLVGMEIWQWIH